MNSAKTNGKRAISAPPIKRNAFVAASKMVQTSAGAVNEDLFISCFEDVPRAQIFTSKDVENEMNKIRDILSDTNTQWEKRIETLKHLRAILIAGAAEYDKFYSYLKVLELPFQLCVKDLRSQIVREACITIAYMSEKVGVKLDRFCEVLLPTLINLIQNSAKIVSTSGIVTIRFIIQYAHLPRLIPLITYNLSSKSKEIRKACCEFLVQLLYTWPTHSLEKHVGILQEAIKKGISDANPEARLYSRKAFWGFASHFKEQATCLLNSLDHSKQRMLHDEQFTMTNANAVSTPAIPYTAYTSQPTRKVGHCVSTSCSVENLSRPLSSLSGKNRSGIPVFAQKAEVSNRALPSPLRSTSAIDMAAAQRAKARAAFCAAMVQPKVNTFGQSLPRTTPRRLNSLTNATAITSPERISRSKVRVSQSQPSSRSTSPSLHTLMQVDSRGSRIKRKSGIPVYTSRETSPNRSSYAAMERRLSSGSSRGIKPYGDANDRNLACASSALAERLDTRVFQQIDDYWISRDFKELSSASQDSGISQIDGSSNNHKSSPSPPTFSSHSSPSKNGHASLDVFDEVESTLNCFKFVFDNLNGAPKDVDFQKEVLNELVELIRDGDSEQWSKHFKEALRILLDKINKDESSVIRALSLKVMCELLLKQTQYFENFIEFTILQLLEACRDREKEVQRAAEICAGTAASVLPSEQCLRVLKSVIITGEFPLNQVAIKMLNKLVEKREPSVVTKLLPEMMPALIQAYDNPESSVRKAAVLCMVAINNSVGDELKPHLLSLNVSKMKLLKLYIDRSKSASNSSCNSPISPRTAS